MQPRTEGRRGRTTPAIGAALGAAMVLSLETELNAAPRLQEAGAAGAASVVPREWLVIAPVDQRGRRPFSPNATFARYLLDAAAQPPQEGEKLSGELGVEKAWTLRKAGEDGTVGGEPVQMAYAAVDWPEDGVALADLDGALILWVNGVPQVGDLYRDGMGGLPVPVKKGRNHVYVTGTRGDFRLALSSPDAPLIVNPFDATQPDFVACAVEPRGLAAVLLVNASDSPLSTIEVACGSADLAAAFQYEGKSVRTIGPRAILKEPLYVAPRRDHAAFAKPGSVELPVKVTAFVGPPEAIDPIHLEESETVEAASRLSLSIRPALELRRRTYPSYVDDSVQEFAVLPPSDGEADSIVLTLHGAGVDCLAQAASYSQKPDFWIVAPTNRRRFGFDWQDWGRRDAYDVLRAVDSWLDGVESARSAGRAGPARGAALLAPARRRYLTGHSMGGHGVWHLAANDPAAFLAIAPSAGWSSFDSYGGRRPPGALAELWQGADGGSRTLALLENLKRVPTFILHGAGDDNVPLREAQLMLDALTKAGAATLHHFQEGAGHWWDGDAAPGVDCVDWPGIFELFRSAKPPAPADPLSFTTADPSYSSRCRYVEIEQPLEYGKPARIEATYDPKSRRVTVATSNVAALKIDDPEPADVAEEPGARTQDEAERRPPFRLTIDGERPRAIDRGDEAQLPNEESLESGRYDACVLVRRGGEWRALDDGFLPRGEKSPRVSGPFKRVFDQALVLVYGTAGTLQETRELYERARFDAALWWYRANGHAPVWSDADFLADLSAGRAGRGTSAGGADRRNVILYGNLDTNRAWSALLGETCPIQVHRGELSLGGRTYRRDDVGAVFVRPNPPGLALVGAVADTGVRGTRLGYTLTYFVSGAGYPDYAVYSSEILAKGDGGVLAAGWFAHDWSLPGPR
jgi:hypothetical protein